MMNRDINVDRYRGILVLLMILFGLVSYFPSFGIVQQLAKHAPDSFPKTEVFLNDENNIKSAYIAPNMTVCDLASCAFFFIMGFVFVGSYERRKIKYGKINAVKLIMYRYLKIIGIGSIISVVFAYLNDEILHPLSYGIIIVSIIFIVIYFIYLVNKIFKINNNIDKISKISEKLLLFLGIYNIVLNSLNMLFMCFGFTEKFWGIWGVLQHIGFAGFISIIVISILKKNNTKNRLISGIIILLCFTIFHETTLPFLSTNIKIIDNMRLIDAVPDGGIIGGFAYSGLLLLYTTFADLYYKRKDRSYVVLLIIGIISILAVYYVSQSFTAWNGTHTIFTAGISKHFSINKGSISPTYILINSFWCILVFYIFILFEKISIKFDLLKILGRNAIIMFILEFIFIDIVVRFICNVSLLIALIECLIVLFVLIFIAIKLNKNNVILKI